MKQYLAVASDEPLMPVRLSYRIRKAAIYKAFQEMGEIVYDRESKVFNLYFDGPTNAYYNYEGKSEIEHALILARMRFSGDKELIVTTLSHKKANGLLYFLENKFRKKDMRLDKIDVFTKLYENTEENQKDLVIPMDPFEAKFAEERSPDELKKPFDLTFELGQQLIEGKTELLETLEDWSLGVDLPEVASYGTRSGKIDLTEIDMFLPVLQISALKEFDESSELSPGKYLLELTRSMLKMPD